MKAFQDSFQFPTTAMKDQLYFLFFPIMFFLLAGSMYLSAQESKEVKNQIENTASWTRPNSPRKYLNPKISDSMRAVNQFIRQNQKLKSVPQSKFKVGSTSSRKFIAKPPSDSKEKEAGRSVRKLTQSGNPLLSRHSSSPTSGKVTSSKRYVPQAPKDNQDVNRGRSASLLALSMATQKKIGDVNSARTAQQIASLKKAKNQDNIRIGREVQDLVRQSKLRSRNPMIKSGSCYRSTFCARNN